MWTSNEVKKLIELYPDMSNIDIAKELNKTKGSIDNKSFRLNLKKSDKFLSYRNKLGHRTKVIGGGRDLTVNELKKIALKFKTKIEFIKNDEPAYQAARNKNVLNEICSHMSVIKFSTPQLILKEVLDGLFKINSDYNNRKIIKPYELDLYYAEYKLAFEYQGIHWHKNSLNDTTKKKMCTEKGITLIYIHEKTRNYEKDIKKQLIDKLDLINNITKKNYTSIDINDIEVPNVYTKLYNKDELISLAKSYKFFKIFKEKKTKEYKKLLKLGLIDEATKHMVDKKKFIKLSISEIKNIIDKYDCLADFRKNELKLYKHIKRTNKNHLISF